MMPNKSLEQQPISVISAVLESSAPGSMESSAARNTKVLRE